MFRFMTGFGLAMIAGGTAIAISGDKGAERCREDDSILKIRSGAVSLYQAYKKE